MRRYPAYRADGYAHGGRRRFQEIEAASGDAAFAVGREHMSRRRVVRAEGFRALRLLRRMDGDAEKLRLAPQIRIVFENRERQVDAGQAAQERQSA